MSGPRLTVVGLGPGDPGLVTRQVLDTIEATPHRYLRTERHPSASLVTGGASFDSVYDTASTMDEVYRTIVDRLVEAALRHGEIAYAVPGSPSVAEHTVELLLERARVGDPVFELVVLPALSFADLTWTRLGVDPLADGVQIVDGHRFATQAAGASGPLLVAQCNTVEVLSDIKLAVDVPPEVEVTLLHHLGLPDERIETVAWSDLDRAIEPDHLTSVYIPALGEPVAGEVAAFVELVATLRERCPWDAEQTHGSLRPHLLEETYEVLEALDAVEAADSDGAALDDSAADGAALDDAYELLVEELGDLLFQVVFHSVLGTEAGRFTMADVAGGVHHKLRSRHPHVFADVVVDGPDDVEANWEQIKAQEKQRASIMDGIPPGLPALAYAQKVAKRATSAGMTAPVAPASSVPVDDAAAFGDWLYRVAFMAKAAGIDAEQALRQAAHAAESSARRAL